MAQSSQLLICRDEAQRELAARLYPKLEAHYLNGQGWQIVDGRRVVCLSPALAAIAYGYSAAEVKAVPVELPSLPDEELRAWIKAHAEVWVAQVAPPEVPLAVSTDGKPSPLEPSGGAPEAVSTATHADEAIPLDAYEESPTGDPERSWGGWEQPPADWPDAVDLWGDAVELPTVEQKHLPPEIHDYLADQSAIRGVDINQSALNALVVLSGALHNGHGLRPKAGEADYIERPVLWGAAIGLPSVKKGAAQAIAKGPLDEIDLDMRRAVAKAMENRREAELQYEQALISWRKEKLGDKPAKPEPVDLPRLCVDNFTLESLRILEHNPRGKVLLVADELSALFGSLDAYSAKGADKDRPALLRLYESKSYLIDRVQDQRANLPPIFIKSWACSIVGGIQPTMLRRIVERRGMDADGMLARFLVIHARGPYEVDEDASEDKALKAAYADLMQRVVAFIPPLEPCKLDENAAEVRKAFMKWLYGRMKTINVDAYGESAIAALGKYEGTFSRLCLVYHAIACAGAKMPQVSPLVSMDTAVRVRDLLKDVLAPHMQHLHMTLTGETETLKAARRIAGMILAHGVSKLNHTLLHRYINNWRNVKPRAKQEVLQLMIETGWLRQTGRYAYAVNPRIAGGFEERRKAELARRAEAVDNIERAKAERAREPGED